MMAFSAHEGAHAQLTLDCNKDGSVPEASSVYTPDMVGLIMRSLPTMILMYYTTDRCPGNHLSSMQSAESIRGGCRVHGFPLVVGMLVMTSSSRIGNFIFILKKGPFVCELALYLLIPDS